MNKRKRIMIILFLILVGIFIISMTTIFENRITNNKNIEEIDIYEPFKKTNNFKLSNRDRYIKYYENHDYLSYEDVVTYVNIGLDYGFYKYIKPADTKKGINVLVNKYLKLDENYIPNDLEKIDDYYFINGNKNARLLRRDAKIAFEKMSKDSIENKTPVYGQSAFRSYDKQEYLYAEALKKLGEEKADLETARSGHSEHQTGLTIDVSSTKSGNMLVFENTKSYKWMLDNSYKYGFILRYPKGKEFIHGFMFEAWHFRYVGVKVATDMHNNYSNLTYEEYFYKFLD